MKVSTSILLREICRSVFDSPSKKELTQTFYVTNEQDAAAYQRRKTRKVFKKDRATLYGISKRYEDKKL